MRAARLAKFVAPVACASDSDNHARRNKLLRSSRVSSISIFRSARFSFRPRDTFQIARVDLCADILNYERELQSRRLLFLRAWIIIVLAKRNFFF